MYGHTVIGVHVWTPKVEGVHVWTQFVNGCRDIRMGTHGRGGTCMDTQ